MTILDNAKKPTRLMAIVLVVLAICSIKYNFSFGLGFLFLCIPNAAAALWGMKIMMKKKNITAFSLINTYLIKICSVIALSFGLVSYQINWPVFLCGTLLALISLMAIPLYHQEA